MAKRILFLIGVLWAGLASAAPVVTNVTASQQAATKDLVVAYDLTGATNQLWVRPSVQVAGSNITVTSVSGDFGLVVPGTNKVGRWHAGDDWNEQLGTVDLKLIINDGVAPPGTNVPVTIPASLPETGSTAVYYTGDDAQVREGIEWPSPRFTVHDGSVNGYFTDHLTGLMWQRNAYQSASWTAALAAADALTLGGYDDWRLPNIHELRSILGYGNFNPATQAPFSQWNTSFYLSSTTRPGATSYCEGVYLRTGEVGFVSKGGGYYVLVRTAATGTVELAATGQTNSFSAGDDGAVGNGVEWPDPRFEDNGDNTVTDHLYGLMWSKNPLTSGASWNTALNICNGLTLSGYTDWRLPNVNELMSLVDMGESQLTPGGWPAAINTGLYYWTSTSYAGSLSTSAWAVRFQAVGYTLGYYSKGSGFGGYAVRTLDSVDIPDAAAEVPLQRTGAMISYAAGDDGALQKGAWKSFDGSYSVFNYTVQDPVTGLIWCYLPESYTGTWEEAVALCNDLTLAGITSWRLPNIHEMHSIVNFIRDNPALANASYGAAYGQSIPPGYYWSSTTRAADTNQAWAVSLEHGQQYATWKSSISHILPVANPTAYLPKTGQTVSYATGDDGTYRYGRVESYPASERFIDHGNGTITDRRTDLMWLQTASPIAATNWTTALEFCNGMDYGGYSDWRMPNVREMGSLFDYANPAEGFFPDFGVVDLQTNLQYWTSTTFAGNTNSVWTFWMPAASHLTTPKSWNGYVMPVRSDVQP